MFIYCYSLLIAHCPSGKLSKPAIAWWQYIDKITLGLATYLAAALALMMLYFMFSFWWMILKWIYLAIFPAVVKAATTTAASTTAATATAATAAAGSGAATTATAAVTEEASKGLLSEFMKKGPSWFVISKISALGAHINGMMGDKKGTATTTTTNNNNVKAGNGNKKNSQPVHDEEF